MSKTVSLTKEELQDHANMMKLITEKHTDGVKKIRAKIAELEEVLKGGQGDAVINSLVDLSKCLDAVQATTETLLQKLAGKVQNVSIMEDNTGAFKAVQDRLAGSISAAKNAAAR